MAAVCFALTFEFVTRISGAAAEWASALDHEIWNDAVEFETVVESA